MDKNKLQKLGELSNVVLNAKNINEAIHKSADIVKEILDVERVSIFILDRDKDKVWTLRADYIDKIEMPKDSGIVGAVLDSKKPYITNNPYEDEKFNKEFDLKNNFVTKNILAVPIIDAVGKVIGVAEFINKKEDFEDKDVVYAKLFAQYISEPLKFHLGIL